MEWFESLPEELQSAPFFKPGDDGSIRDIGSVIADLSNAANHMGNSIRIPGPDASDEDVKNFQLKAAERIPGLMVTPNLDDEEAMASVLRTLGKPDEPSGYKLPEGAEMGEEALAALRERAHKYGLNNRQFQTLVSDMLSDQTSATEAQQHALKLDLEGLQGEWGQAYPVRLEKIAGLLEKTGAPEYLIESLKGQSLTSGDLKWLYSMAESLGAEGRSLTDDKGDSRDVDPGEALEQIAEIERNPDYRDASSPNQKRLIARHAKLMDLVYPEG